MSLDSSRRHFERLGREDPLWGVLTDSRYKNNRWDADAFFETGRQEITATMNYVGRLPIGLARGSALDFGCGVGRLTQALADHFGEVVGVDIAASFIEHARSCNRHGQRCRYVLNTSDDLGQIGGSQFDFIYSNITLQHTPADAALKYIAEFMRVLRPGGVAIFQIPAGLAPFDGTMASWWLRFRRTNLAPLKRWLKAIRGRPVSPFSCIPKDTVERAVAAHGGKVVDVVQNAASGKGWISLRYCVVKPAR